MLLVNGTLGSLGLVGLIHQILGWQGLELIDGGLYRSALRLTEWWSFLAIDMIAWFPAQFGIKAETNTIAASAALLLLSAVGTKLLSVKFDAAVKLPVKKKVGRPRTDQLAQARSVIWHWLKQKFANALGALKENSWPAAVMVVAYLVLVFAVNLANSPISPDTVKGMAYAVLIYAGFHAVKELLKDGAYVRYLWAMAGSTVGLTAISYWIESSQSMPA